MKTQWVLYSTWDFTGTMLHSVGANIEDVFSTKEAAETQRDEYLNSRIYHCCECAIVIEETIYA